MKRITRSEYNAYVEWSNTQHDSHMAQPVTERDESTIIIAFKPEASTTQRNARSEETEIA